MMVADLARHGTSPPPDSAGRGSQNNASVRKVKFLKNVRMINSPVTEEEYQDILRMAGIAAHSGLPLP